MSITGPMIEEQFELTKHLVAMCQYFLLFNKGNKQYIEYKQLLNN